MSGSGYQVRVLDKVASYFTVRFDYRDRCFRGMRNEVRDLRGRRWHARDCSCAACRRHGELRQLRPCWTLPVAAKGRVLGFAKRWRFSYDPAWFGEAKAPPKNSELLALSKATDAPGLELGGVEGELYGFQRAGVAYLMATKRTLLADEMGLGKTPQSLCALDALEAFPALVVCPASIKTKWAREVRRWIGPHLSVQVVEGGRSPIRGADVTIVNYDLLRVAYLWELSLKGLVWTPERKWHQAVGLKVRVRAPNEKEATVQAVQKLRGKHMGVSLADCQIEHKKLRGPTKLWGLSERLQALKLRGVVFDESHYLKNKAAARSRAAKALARGVDARFLLTGTPVLNRPEELAHQLDVLGRLEELFGSWMGFTRTYCGGEETRWGYQARGHNRLEELNEVLRSHCFVRRRKRDVLSELPPMQRAQVDVELANRGEYERAEAHFLQWLAERKGSEAAMRAAMAEQLARITHLKHLAARGKMPAFKAWVREFLEGSEEKLLVFAIHRDIVEDLAESFGWLSIHGDTPKAVGPGSSKLTRQEICDRFQTDPDCRGLVLQIQAAGVGLDLTAASNSAFAELPWTPGELEQAEARSYGRMSDLHGATAWYLVAGNTIEEWLLELLAAKQEVVDAATDGEARTSQGEVLRALVDRLALERSGVEQPSKASAAPDPAASRAPVPAREVERGARTGGQRERQPGLFGG